MLNLKKIRESNGIRSVVIRRPLSDIISESYTLLYECEDGSRIKTLVEKHLTDVRDNPSELERLSNNLNTLQKLSEKTSPVIPRNFKALKEDEGLDDPRIDVKDETDLEIDTDMKEIEGLEQDEEFESSETQSREDKTATAEEDTEGAIAEAAQFSKFAENVAGKLFVKNMATKLREGTGKVFNLKESIGLYKASNSMMTQMAIELEHNEAFKETFDVCSTVLGYNVAQLLESIRKKKAIPGKVLESLQRFSTALKEEDEVDDFIDWVEDEYEEVPISDVVQDILDTVPAGADDVAEELVDALTGDIDTSDVSIGEEDLTPEEVEDLKNFLVVLRGDEDDGSDPTDEEIEVMESRVLAKRAAREGRKISSRRSKK